MVRNKQHDHLLALLITTIVLGHVVQDAATVSPFLQEINRVLYPFQMPGFALLSGLHTRTESPKSLLVHLLKWAGVYFVAQSAAVLLLHVEIDKPIAWQTWFTPFWALWYLPALIGWKCVFPIWKRLPAPVVCALLFSGVACALEGFGSVMRAFVYFPYFVFGACGRGQNQNFFQDPRDAFGGFLFLSVLHYFWIPIGWTLGSNSFSTMHVSMLEGMFWLTLRFSLSVALVVCLIGCMPTRRTWFARFGERSLPIFLWHTLFLFWFHRQPWLLVWYRSLSSIEQVGAILIIVAGVSLCLSSDPVNRLTQALAKGAELGARFLVVVFEGMPRVFAKKALP